MTVWFTDVLFPVPTVMPGTSKCSNICQMTLSTKMYMFAFHVIGESQIPLQIISKFSKLNFVRFPTVPLHILVKCKCLLRIPATNLKLGVPYLSTQLSPPPGGVQGLDKTRCFVILPNATTSPSCQDSRCPHSS